MKNIRKYYIICIAAAILVMACQKMERPALGDYPSDTPVTPSTPLRFYVPFDSMSTEAGSKLAYRFADSISANPSFPANVDLGYAPGIRGTAFRGADGTALKYVNANDLKDATSFTIAFWIKRDLNTRTEFYFGIVYDTAMADTGDQWKRIGMFMMVESGTLTDAIVKTFFLGQWLEFGNASRFKKPLLNGQWHHLALTYDETTSKMAYYFDGALVGDAPASATNVLKDGQRRGKADLSRFSNLIIGGTNKHIGLKPDDSWMSSFLGNIDQFRVYNKVLTSAEVAELYNGRL